MIPLGGLGPGSTGSPPPELLRYKNFLYLLVVGYAAIVVTTLSIGQVSLSFNYMIMLIMVASMASRADQCMMTCIAPFFLFGILSVLFDLVNVIALLSAPYPGAGHIFSSHCPEPVDYILPKNATVYLTDAAVNGTAAYTVPKDTQVKIPRDLCSAVWVVRNVMLLLGAVLDIVASRLGYKMFKASMELSLADGQDPNQNQGPLAQQLMMAPQGGFGGQGGQGGQGNGGRNGGGQAGQRPQQFQPFQGSGQTLSA